MSVFPLITRFFFKSVRRTPGLAICNSILLSIGVFTIVIALKHLLGEFAVGNSDQTRNVFRVLRETQTIGGAIHTTGTSGRLGPAAKASVPGVTDAVRLLTREAWVVLERNTARLRVCIADTSVVRIFGLSIHTTSSLEHSGAIAVSKSASQRFFPGKSPLGRSIRVEDDFLGGQYVIVGTFEELSDHTIPPSSEARFDLLTFTPVRPRAVRDWNTWNRRGSYRSIATYLVLQNNDMSYKAEEALQSLLADRMGPDIARKNRFHLQDISRIHLFSKKDYGIGHPLSGDIQHVFVFSLGAMAIFLVSVVNIVGNCLAMHFERSQEFAIRKALGEAHSDLAIRLLLESFFFGVLCVPIAVLLWWTLTLADSLPTHLTFSQVGLTDLAHLALLSPAVAFLSVLPATAWISRSNIARLTKRRRLPTGSLMRARRISSFVQAFSAICLLAFAIVITRQARYLSDEDPGFNYKGVVSIPIFRMARNITSKNLSLNSKYETIRDQFSRHGAVSDVAGSRYPIGAYVAPNIFEAEGKAGEELHVGFFPVDLNFLSFFSIPLVAGRHFMEDQTDERPGYDGQFWMNFIINESAAKLLGWDHAVGKKMGWIQGTKGRVIGVARDFNNLTRHKAIMPMALVAYKGILNFLYVRVNEGQLDDYLEYAGEVWKQFLPEIPFRYDLLEENLKAGYTKELGLATLTRRLSWLSLFLLVVSTFGSNRYEVRRRTREISVRRVLGSTLFEDFVLLQARSMKTTVWGAIAACPLFLYGTSKWMDQFAYKVDESILPLISAIMAVFATSFVPGAYHLLRVHRLPPTYGLREE